MKKYKEDIVGLAGLGSIGSLLTYAATQVKDFELSRVGEVVGGPYCASSGGVWGGVIFCGETPRRIITLAEAMNNMLGYYEFIGILLGLTAVGTYHVIKDVSRKRRGELG